ncbi:MAG: BON domain-containing protein, partial [Candidatus Sulfotelmatobacter sp.]
MPVVLLALIATLAANVGCARKPDDAKISSDIQSKYAQDSGLSTKQLSVQTSSGVVTISGNVDNDAQRAAAARQAASVDGVKEVVNNLQVGIPSNASAAVAAPSKDAVMNAARSKADKNSSVVRKSNHSHAAENSAMADNSGPASDSAIANDSQEPPPVSSDQPPADSSSNTPPIPAAPPQPLKVTIEQGTPISVRLIDSIDSEKNQIGDTFHASLNAPLSAEGSEAFPAGTDVAGHIVDLKSASKFAGQSLVVLQLDSITSNGKSYGVQTDRFRKEGSSRGKSTAEKVGGGAILGGIIGAIAGGGRG